MTSPTSASDPAMIAGFRLLDFDELHLLRLAKPHPGLGRGVGEVSSDTQSSEIARHPVLRVHKVVGDSGRRKPGGRPKGRGLPHSETSMTSRSTGFGEAQVKPGTPLSDLLFFPIPNPLKGIHHTREDVEQMSCHPLEVSHIESHGYGVTQAQ